MRFMHGQPLRVKMSRQQRLLFIAGALIIMVTLSLSWWNATRAATATMVPTSDVTSAWPTCSTTCSAMMQYSYVDEGTTANTADWIGTGTNGAGGEVVEFGLDSPSSVASATQVVVNVNLRSATLGSSADTVGFALRVNGTLQAVTTVTMTSTFTNYSATFNGSWTQADVDSMQIYLIRNVVGTGPGSGRDDDVQLANVYATVTYTPSLTITQADYRWFANADSATPGAPLAAQNTPADIPADGKARLQVLLHQDGSNAQATDRYRLEYAAIGSDAVCDPSFSGEVYQSAMPNPTTRSPATVVEDFSGGGTVNWKIKMQKYGATFVMYPTLYRTGSMRTMLHTKDEVK